jgi:hypothetical protein
MHRWDAAHDENRAVIHPRSAHHQILKKVQDDGKNTG